MNGSCVHAKNCVGYVELFQMLKKRWIVRGQMSSDHRVHVKTDSAFFHILEREGLQRRTNILYSGFKTLTARSSSRHMTTHDIIRISRIVRQ